MAGALPFAAGDSNPSFPVAAAMSSPAARPYAGAPSPQPIFPDEILGEIFLRLDSAADLARASAARTAFIRVVRFLRRNRSLYRRLVVSFLPSEARSSALRHPRSLHHAEPPHRSASAGRALAQLVDLTFSFLPNPSSWRICDAGDGRILLSADTPANFVNLVVCDPLQRRYVRIAPIPNDLTAGTSRPYGLSFLAPASEDESSFGVIWMRLFGKVSAFVFSSATGKWRGVTFDDCWKGRAVMLTSCRYHAHISLCQTSGLFSDVLMLDTRRMEFAVVRIPCVRVARMHAIVELEDGRLGLLTLGNDMLDLCCKAWEDNHASAEEWQHEKTIPLPDSNSLRYTFISSGAGYLLLQAMPRDPSELVSSSLGVPKVQYFTLEVKTLLLEKLCVSDKRIDLSFEKKDKRIDFAHLYVNSPLLSLSTV
jgi:hypothetical protein